MMATTPPLDHVIEELYSSALQPEKIPDALHSYARVFNGTGTAVIPMIPEGGRTLHSPDLAEAADEYARFWWQHDFRLFRAEQRRLRGYSTDLDLSTEEERRSHPFYQEFAPRYGLSWFCAFSLRLPGATPIAVSIQRAERFGPFLAPELEALAPIGRHISRAIDLAARISSAREHHATLCDCLTHIGHGVIGLSSSGSVIFASPLAERMAAGIFQITAGTLVCRNQKMQRRMDRLISEVLALAAGRASHPPRPAALEGGSAGHPIAAYGIPVASPDSDLLAILGGRPKALLVLVDPEAARDVDGGLLQEMFSLSGRVPARGVAEAGWPSTVLR